MPLFARPSGRGSASLQRDCGIFSPTNLRGVLARAAVAASLAVAMAPADAAANGCTLSVASDDDIAAQQGFAALAPGSTVCIAAGTYRRSLVIVGVKGSAAAPIRFVVSPEGARAAFTAGVLLRGASYVTVAGLDVTQDPVAAPWAAVTLDSGADHDVVRGFTVHEAFVGIAVGSSAGAAGAGNQVLENLVRDNWNTGIAVGALSDGTANEYTLIQRNRVLASGGHGIEVTDANYIAIRDNVVSGNGTGLHSLRQGGFSGIHLFAAEATTPTSAHGLRAAHDVISGNRVDGTGERPATQACDDGSGAGVCADGNGIQVDRFCSLDEVVGNTVTGNAGDGISIYGASGNLIKDNLARGNNQQVDRRRLFPGPAEIAISAVNLPAGSTRGNTVTGNIATTTVNKIPAFYLSTNAGRNRIEADNQWRQDAQAGPDASWGPVVVGTAWVSAAAAQRAFEALGR